MKAIIVDDEKYAIEELKYFLKEYPIKIVNTYYHPESAIENLQIDKPELVFLDINMPGLNGIEAALAIQNELPEVIFVFVTAYTEYALEAYKAHPFDYILKPIDPDAFKLTMEALLKKLQINYLQSGNGKDLLIDCYGKFRMYSKSDEEAKFPTKKSKELLAYLLCHLDKPIYRNEVIMELFDAKNEDKAQNNFYVTLYRLRNTLNRFMVGRDQLIIKENSILYIKEGICNFIDFKRFVQKNLIITCENIIEAEDYFAQYSGEFLTDIDSSWVIETREWLGVKMEELTINMAKYYINRNELKDAERIIKKMIDINPMFLYGYEFLLDVYRNMNEQESFVSIYKKYKKILKEELNQSIEKKYSFYYERIL